MKAFLNNTNITINAIIIALLDENKNKEEIKNKIKKLLKKFSLILFEVERLYSVKINAITT